MFCAAHARRADILMPLCATAPLSIRLRLMPLFAICRHFCRRHRCHYCAICRFRFYGCPPAAFAATMPLRYACLRRAIIFHYFIIYAMPPRLRFIFDDDAAAAFCHDAIVFAIFFAAYHAAMLSMLPAFAVDAAISDERQLMLMPIALFLMLLLIATLSIIFTRRFAMPLF
jgi:hypothetical protein